MTGTGQRQKVSGGMRIKKIIVTGEDLPAVAAMLHACFTVQGEF
jgi:hypothetical protein